MTRYEALKSRTLQYPYFRLAKKLSDGDLMLMNQFIIDHDSLDHLEFEYAVNRMFLDKPKPKHFTIIQELLVMCNTVAFGRNKKS